MKIDLDITRTAAIRSTPRRKQVEGKFDLSATEQSTRTWHASIDLPEGPFLGAIIGPSGSGKTTLARALADKLGGIFVAPKDAHGHACEPFQWPADACLVDGFPEEMAFNEVVNLLSSVGFSSPPHWMIPYGALSNGEQFRANLARGLAESKLAGKPVCFDEFASLVHDVPAKIGSAALSKAVRTLGMQVIVDTWRTDVLEWLEPDWVLFVNADGTTDFQTNLNGDARRWVRPDVRVEIFRTTRKTWELFRHAHYLSHSLHPNAGCFVGVIDGVPAVFTAVIAFPHPKRPGFREHRTVCLPDFQGIGLGNAMSAFIGSLYSARGKPYYSATSNPAMIRHRKRNIREWRLCREASFTPGKNGFNDGYERKVNASQRLTVSFQYIGPDRAIEAGNFGLLADPKLTAAVCAAIRKDQPQSATPKARSAARSKTRASKDRTARQRPQACRTS